MYPSELLVHREKFDSHLLLPVVEVGLDPHKGRGHLGCGFVRARGRRQEDLVGHHRAQGAQEVHVVKQEVYIRQHEPRPVWVKGWEVVYYVPDDHGDKSLENGHYHGVSHPSAGGGQE